MARSTKIALENRDKYIALGLNIAYYRKREGMTQDQLAEKAGMSRSYLGEIEAPNMITTMSLEVLFNIANVLRIKPSKLLEFRD
ncbi:DNA-binding XRE family transcriptional regulator [Desulfitobacterium sp. LBE]|nr:MULTISPECIES: helix-turn-helix transcriptional regulator [Desulfitobacterium]ACL20893.1 transcriptional regulator, XRE family [Desulfitobacterium hafniense DCB-2]EHL04766.1 DNA-binding helix-turn-helix protein [Desulfitobacterium hafniense DP7]KTE91174.1 DNA-binding protein [Desulfitobacterium hafniense]MEA5025366.1 helix-turn-helix transcriptional regulator [Desulfitobacterium hafniense]TWH56284.1 DNA-binding XRE family transcriptional regulator [Desulfitobacterium sp. LBE]